MGRGSVVGWPWWPDARSDTASSLLTGGTKRCAAAACLGWALAAPLLAQPAPPALTGEDLVRHFDAHSVDGTFVLYDLARDRWIRHNPERAGQRLLPASTFKIFHSLVALETGVVADERETIPWDGVDRGSRGWNQDQTLRTAFQRSAVWAYQKIARRIGEETMLRYLRAEGYGNGDVSGGIDAFWLTGGLRISADEQVEFLRRLYAGELGFSERSMRVVRELMILEQTPFYTLRGKTGWARPQGPDGPQIGWLVGWVEGGEATHFFALHLESRDPDFPMVEARREIACGILRELGVLPGEGRGH